MLAKIVKYLSLVFLIAVCLVGCGDKKDKKTNYASQLKLEREYEGKTFLNDGIEVVTLLNKVDGDTAHFTLQSGEAIKIRFLGIDTPESTGNIEPYGLAASKFTSDRLESASSIIIESNDSKANPDSTGTRYLAFVWYRTSESKDYTCLNLEILQEGYSKAKSAGDTKYGDILTKAAAQANELELALWSGEKDPEFWYEDPISVDLKILRESAKDYFLKKVTFTAVVTRIDGETIYVQEEVNGQAYGFQVYKAFLQTRKLEIGNKVRISGFVSYYETGDVYQIVGIKDVALSDAIDNLKVIERNCTITPIVETAESLNNKTAGLATLVKLENVVVKSTYTTKTGNSAGAITITGEINGQAVTIRTIVMFDLTGEYLVDETNKILASNFTNKTIDVVGIVDYYEGNYQIKLTQMSDVVFK